MPANVCFCVDQLVVNELLLSLFLLVRKDDISAESLSHEQILAQSSGASSKNIVGMGGNNGAKRKNKVVDHLHVEEVGRH